MKIELLDKKNPPNGFDYPKALKKLVELNLINFDIWYFFEPQDAKIRLEGLKERYPDRVLVPFARRIDNDDIACLGMDGEKVFIIHDFASSGYEQREVYQDIWEWLRNVVNIMIEYEKMEMEWTTKN